MSSLDLDQVLYARANWRKAILIPLWTFQILILLCLMGVFAYRLAETFDHYEELNKLGEVPIVEVVWEATNVGFNLIALVLNILQIARKATERLTPFMMVCTDIIKLTLAFAVLALDIVAYLQRMDGHYSTIGLSLDCGLLAANLATFTYAIVTYRRLLKYEDYHLTANAKAHGGYVPGGDSVELGYNNKAGGHSQGIITTTTTTELRYSDADSSYPSQTQPQPQSHPSQQATYSAYAPPTPTGADLKKEVDRAMGYEFGWSSSGSGPAGGTGGGGRDESVNRSGSVVVGSGKVAVHHGMVAAPAVGVHRQQSWVTERGVIVEGGEEAEDDDEGRGVGKGNGNGPVMGRVVDGPARMGEGRREDDEEVLLPK